MRCASFPQPPELGPWADPVLGLLRDVLEALHEAQRGSAARAFRTEHLDAPQLELLSSILGQGDVEVSVKVDREYLVEASCLPGLWCVRALGPGRQPGALLLEVCDVPAVVRAAAEQGGQVQGLSRGYQTCRIACTGRRVWSVQYSNALGEVVVDTLEAGDVPSSLCAGREDFEGSAARLGDMLEAFSYDARGVVG
jgi:hypothetical protein